MRGLFPLAAQEPVTQPVSRGFAHGALDAQPEAVMSLAGVLDALFSDDEGGGQGADVESSGPSTRGAGQPGALQAEDGAGMPQADLGNEGVEASTARCRGAGVALIWV